MFLFGPRPSMLIHHEDGSYSAFDAVCTHLGCTVRFEPENRRIHCPCHGGVYDINTGAVVSGPPPRALKAYRAEAADGNGHPGPKSQGLYEWLDDRLSLSEIGAFARHKMVPQHKQSFWYYWGGISLFLFILQLFTGILLLVCFRPLPSKLAIQTLFRY
jgi:nitrite reductase/ring-hydroxylating ferredoxin subunit